MKQRATKKIFKIGDGGFTIIEIVVVAFLMLISIYPAMRVLSSALENSNQEQYLTQSAFLAQMKMEHLRATAECYTDMSGPAVGCPKTFCDDIAAPGCLQGTPPGQGNTNFGQVNFNLTAAQCSFPAPYQKYRCTVKDTNAVGAVAGYLKDLQVEVWYDKNQNQVWDTGEAGVRLQTKLARRSPIPG